MIKPPIICWNPIQLQSNSNLTTFNSIYSTSAEDKSHPQQKQQQWQQQRSHRLIQSELIPITDHDLYQSQHQQDPMLDIVINFILAKLNRQDLQGSYVDPSGVKFLNQAAAGMLPLSEFKNQPNQVQKRFNDTNLGEAKPEAAVIKSNGISTTSNNDIKNNNSNNNHENNDDTAGAATNGAAIKRKRGRPRKNFNPADSGNTASQKEKITKVPVNNFVKENVIKAPTNRRSTRNSKRSMLEVASIEKMLTSSGDSFSKIKKFKKSDLFLTTNSMIRAVRKHSKQERKAKIEAIKKRNNIKLKEKVIGFEEINGVDARQEEI